MADRAFVALSISALFLSISPDIALAKCSPCPTYNSSILDLTTIGGRPPANVSAPDLTDWNGALCDDKTFPDHPIEWEQAPGGGGGAEDRETYVAGTVVNSDIPGPGGDFYFAHPFGNDDNINLLVDAPYTWLGARATAVADGDLDSGAIAATNMGLPSHPLFHVEMDGDFVPTRYDVQPRDRVAAMGRWIVDCGHESFKTELHPPLVMVVAHPVSSEETRAMVSSRAWLTGQTYQTNAGNYDGSSFVDLLAKDEFPNALLQDSTLLLGVPPYQLSAVVDIAPQNFSGVATMEWLVRPSIKSFGIAPPVHAIFSSSPAAPATHHVWVSYAFKVRSGVSVQLSQKDSQTVQVIAVLNSAGYHQAVLPSRDSVTVSTADLLASRDVSGLSGTPLNVLLNVGSGGTNPTLLPTINLGIAYFRYRTADPPDAVMSPDYRIDKLPAGNTVVSIDDSQPYPIRGEVVVHWGP